MSKLSKPNYVFANPSKDSLAVIRRSLEENLRGPHYCQLSDLRQIMRITKKTITLKDDVVLVCKEGRLFIPTFSQTDNFWRLRHLPNEFYILIKNIGITIEESMYLEFMNNNNYTFTPNQHILMIVEFN